MAQVQLFDRILEDCEGEIPACPHGSTPHALTFVSFLIIISS